MLCSCANVWSAMLFYVFDARVLRLNLSNIERDSCLGFCLSQGKDYLNYPNQLSICVTGRPTCNLSRPRLSMLKIIGNNSQVPIMFCWLFLFHYERNANSSRIAFATHRFYTPVWCLQQGWSWVPNLCTRAMTSFVNRAKLLLSRENNHVNVVNAIWEFAFISANYYISITIRNMTVFTAGLH